VHVPRTRSRTNLAIPNQNLVDTAPASGSHAHATNTATMPAPNHPGNHGTPLAVEDDGNGYVCIDIYRLPRIRFQTTIYLCYIYINEILLFIFYLGEENIIYIYKICTRSVTQKNKIIYSI
jgi:hypothetical protein